MKQTLILLVVFCLCVLLPWCSWAEEHLLVMENLGRQLSSSPSRSVEPIILEQIAVVTYQVLLDIPFLGLQGSQTLLEEVIALKDTLSVHSGMVERLFALRLQEAVNCALLHELYRRTMWLRDEEMTPPYYQGSLTDELVRSLLERNALAEVEYTQYLLTHDGPFTQFCHQKDLDVNAILSGEAIRKFPRDLKKRMVDLLSYFLAIHDKMDRATMQDFLFTYALHMIDQTRDVRILSEVFLTDPSFSLSMIDTRKINRVLRNYPHYRRRVSFGEKNRGRWIFPTGSHCASPRSDHYPIILTDVLDPYFRDVDAIASQHEGIFSWYNQSGAMPLSKFKTGMWLELKE